MGERLTDKRIKNNLEQLGFKLECYYRNEKSKLYVKVTCENGHIDEVRYDTIIKRGTCKYCKEYTFTYDYVKNYIEKYNQTLLSSTYINARSNLDVKCEFGHVYHPTFDNFKNKKSRCPICEGLNKHDYFDVKQYIESVGYFLLSKEYENNKSLLLVRCNNGHEYYTTFDNFKNKSKRCGCCNGGIVLRYEDVKMYVESRGYSLVSDEYVNAKTKLHLQCKNNHLYEVTFDNFKNNESRCPYCLYNSKGEERVAEILNLNNIKYIRQHRFSDCVYKYTLPFDFFLPESNTLIEYDGIQHFEPIDVFGGVDGFNGTQKRDGIKNSYCYKNNINLIRIPYWEFDNIENYLKINNLI